MNVNGLYSYPQDKMKEILEYMKEYTVDVFGKQKQIDTGIMETFSANH